MTGEKQGMMMSLQKKKSQSGLMFSFPDLSETMMEGSGPTPGEGESITVSGLTPGAAYLLFLRVETPAGTLETSRPARVVIGKSAVLHFIITMSNCLSGHAPPIAVTAPLRAPELARAVWTREEIRVTTSDDDDADPELTCQIQSDVLEEEEAVAVAVCGGDIRVPVADGMRQVRRTSNGYIFMYHKKRGKYSILAFVVDVVIQRTDVDVLSIRFLSTVCSGIEETWEIPDFICKHVSILILTH